MTKREMRVRSLTFGAIGLGVGLLAGLVFLVHNASAQRAEASPTGHFQYTCLPRHGAPSSAEALAQLNAMGADGWRVLWEHSSPSDTSYCFERRY